MTKLQITRRAIAAALPALALAGRARGAAALPASSEVVRSLAPTGRLKVAINLGNAVLAQKDPKTGVVSGVIMDITAELVRRIKVPVDYVYYDAGGKIAPALAADHWDLTYLGTDQSRAAGLLVTTPYLYLDGTYMVHEAAPYHAVADLDRDGLRVSAAANSAYDLFLSANLKHAKVVHAPTTPASIALFEQGGAEAAAGVRQALMDAAQAAPGYRVLPDAYTRIDQAVTLPPGREVGFRYVQALIEDLKASGFIRAALDRTGQTGATVAPAA